jgi:hypothetical protein
MPNAEETNGQPLRKEPDAARLLIAPFLQQSSHLDDSNNSVEETLAEYTTRGITLRFSWPMIPRCDVAGAC